jgi:hypothetical protein
MKTVEVRIIINVILVLVTIISGIWLSRLGRPLNTPLFTVHKIIALLTIILTVIIVYQLQKNIELSNIELILIIASAIFFLLAFVSGALLSFDKLAVGILQMIHKVTPLLLVISTGLAIYLMAKGR